MSIQTRLRSTLRRLALAGAYGLRFQTWIHGPTIRDRVIVTYHGVDAEDRTTFNLRFCSQRRLARHLRFYSSHFEVTTVEEVFERERFSERPGLAITFDDGYRNNYLRAAPVLREFGLPATFYVTSASAQGVEMLPADAADLLPHFVGNATVTINGLRFDRPATGRFRNADVGTLNEYLIHLDPDTQRDAIEQLRAAVRDDSWKTPPYTDYWELMRTEDLVDLAGQRGLSLGCHGVSHSLLPSLSSSAARAELCGNRNFVQEITGQPPESVAYPYGAYTRQLLDVAEELGLKYQLATDAYLHDDDRLDPRVLTRVGLYADLSPAEQFHRIDNRMCAAEHVSPG